MNFVPSISKAITFFHLSYGCCLYSSSINIHKCQNNKEGSKFLLIFNMFVIFGLHNLVNRPFLNKYDNSMFIIITFVEIQLYLEFNGNFEQAELKYTLLYIQKGASTCFLYIPSPLPTTTHFMLQK
jgi:hypothetical protein